MKKFIMFRITSAIIITGFGIIGIFRLAQTNEFVDFFYIYICMCFAILINIYIYRKNRIASDNITHSRVKAIVSWIDKVFNIRLILHMFSFIIILAIIIFTPVDISNLQENIDSIFLGLHEISNNTQIPVLLRLLSMFATLGISLGIAIIFSLMIILWFILIPLLFTALIRSWLFYGNIRGLTKIISDANLYF